MECRAYAICMDSQSGGHLGQDRKVPSKAGGNLSRMHKTEKTAKESRMNYMYSHLCDTTLDGHRIAQILATGDATSRALLLALHLHALGGEMGYPSALSARTWSWPSSPRMALEPRQRWKGS